MKFKRFLVLLLITVAIVFSLAACDNGKSDGDPQGKNGTTSGKVVQPIHDGGSYDFD